MDAVTTSRESTVVEPEAAVAPARPRPSGLAASDLVLVALVVLGAGLRLVHLGTVALTPDETFSASVSHLPMGRIASVVRASDSHPPLSYWLLHPITELTHSTALLRLPAALCSIGALVIMALWQRHRGVGGLVATAVFAVAPFELIFGREVRMYGLVELTAIAAVWAAFRWLEGDERARWVVLAAGAAFALAMSHGAGIVLLGALVLVPLLRRDRAAWRWRAAIAGAVAVFLAYWAPSIVHRSGWTTIYPAPSFSWLMISVNESLAPVPSDRYLVVGLVALGVAALLWRDRVMGRVMAVLFLLPLATITLLSLRVHMLGPKALVMLGWAPAIAIGALAHEAARWRPLAAGVVVSVVALLVLPYVGPAIGVDEHLGPMMAAVSAARVDGDAVAIRRAPGGHIYQWYFGVVDGLAEHPLHLDIPDTAAYVYGNRPWDGKVWLVENVLVPPATVRGVTDCGNRRAVGPAYFMRCIQFPTGRSGG